MRESQPGCRAVRILLIEDDADTRILLREALEDEGYEVGASASAEEALDAVRSARPDIILADIGLPGMDGYEFLRRLREVPEGAGVPAFALSAHVRAEDVRQAEEAGYEAHLAKPVDVPTLSELIRGRFCGEPEASPPPLPSPDDWAR